MTLCWKRKTEDYPLCSVFFMRSILEPNQPSSSTTGTDILQDGFLKNNSYCTKLSAADVMGHLLFNFPTIISIIR
jgi:hypothetical protein